MNAPKTNRLPPNKIEITGCRDCPLRARVVASWGDEETHDICQHPELRERELAGENEEPPETPPDFCPLVHAPLQLVVAGEA